MKVNYTSIEISLPEARYLKTLVEQMIKITDSDIVKEVSGNLVERLGDAEKRIEAYINIDELVI